MSADEPNPPAAGIAASPDQLERLFNAALDAVVGMDSDGAVTAWNKTAETIEGGPLSLLQKPAETRMMP